MTEKATAGEPANDSQLTYEEGERLLTDLIARLDSGDASLEESLQIWERATRLELLLRDKLTDARARLTAVAPAVGEVEAGRDVQSEDPWSATPTPG